MSHHKLLEEIRGFFSARPAHEKDDIILRWLKLQLQLEEYAIMQISELGGKMTEVLNALSGLEADVGALVARAGQASGGNPSTGGSGLSEADQSTIDSIGAGLGTLKDRIAALQAQVVGVDASGNKVDAPPPATGTGASNTSEPNSTGASASTPPVTTPVTPPAP